MDSLTKLLEQGRNSSTLLLLITALCAILFLAVLALFSRANRLDRRIAALTLGGEGNMEQILTQTLENVAVATRRMEGLERSVEGLQLQIPRCIQKSRLVRYDAFDNVGGQQSFSLVLLDDNRSGVVLSGVYNRMDMRVYAKYIERGEPSQPLSEEETKAFRDCIGA